MEKYPGDYKPYDYANVLSAEDFRKLPEGVGMYAGGLSLALLGVGPETLDQPRQSEGFTSPAATYETPVLHELEELAVEESLKRLAQLSLHGSVERFNKYDTAA
ncbi:MAG TPA: hypothetical protein VFL85_02395 [Candidatus Saccharimonadales bacterium]|nr:hypothetical protein [Candidatus Saccharimonadales bacterium]